MTISSTSNAIIIYGGGMAGAILAKRLSSTNEVILVDPNDYFEVPMAAPRNLLTPDFAKKAIIPFSIALPNVQHIRGTLTQLTPEGGLVTLHNNQQIKLSGAITVLATGSHFSNSLMRAANSTYNDRQEFYLRYSQKINQSKQILIVGGGPIGVEVAGEITDKYHNKSLTLLESGPRLLAGTTKEASQSATAELKQRGVNIITNERLVSSSSSTDEVFCNAGVAITSTEREIPYDLIIWCIGGKPNTTYMNTHFKQSLNHKGQIKVTPYLRVSGYKYLFALGDITDLEENKMAWFIDDQVKKAAYNIRQVLAGQTNDKSLKKYKAQTGNPKMAVTLGSRQGVLYLPVIGLITCPAITRIAKSSHMLVPKYRTVLGV